MATSAAPPRSPLRFCLLVFALSLPFWLAGAVAERRGFQLGLPVNLPVSSLMAFCPLVAAVVLVHRGERPGGVRGLLRRVLDYRRIGRGRWWVAILLLNPAMLLGSYEMMRLLGRPPTRCRTAGAPSRPASCWGRWGRCGMSCRWSRATIARPGSPGSAWRPWRRGS
jgi:hypothetical protein